MHSVFRSSRREFNHVRDDWEAQKQNIRDAETDDVMTVKIGYAIGVAHGAGLRHKTLSRCNPAVVAVVTGTAHTSTVRIQAAGKKLETRTRLHGVPARRNTACVEPSMNCHSVGGRSMQQSVKASLRRLSQNVLQRKSEDEVPCNRMQRHH